MTATRIVLVSIAVAWCMTVASAQQFEVASIRPATFPAAEYFAGFTDGAGLCAAPRLERAGPRVTIHRVTLCGLVRLAYDVKDYQVVGMPAWMTKKEPSIFYEVEARTGGETPATSEQVQQMVRSLLTERFQLVMHQEERDIPVYVLTVDKNGPTLTGGVHERCQLLPKGSVSVGPGTCWGMTMAQFAVVLSREVDRAVVDRTGLAERYAFSLEMPRGRRAFDPDVPSIFTAVQEQLGLRLVPQRMPAGVVVIDRAEPPSPN
jgi:uncharacterized protein (TIGR03435 family)